MTESWYDRARCSGIMPEELDFFPSDGKGTARAKAFCEECPVIGECLDYALEHKIDHGVWGGSSERQRRAILKARKKAARPVEWSPKCQ